MSCGIYKITNLINQKCYIGQSICIEERWNDERTDAFNPNGKEYNKTLCKAIRKHGLNNFSFEILEECPRASLDEKEIYYISKYDSYYSGYNDTTGGSKGYDCCNKISKEQLLEIYDLLLNTDISQNEIASKYGVGQDTISTINQGKTRRQDGYNYPLRNNYPNTKYYCIDCGIEIVKGSLRCNICNHKQQYVCKHPNREELKNLIRNKPFLQIGKQYGVSDNAIRKWCKSMNLPFQKKVINSYSDEEWNKI